MQRFAFKRQLKPGKAEEQASPDAALSPERAELSGTDGKGDDPISPDHTLLGAQRQEGAASSSERRRAR